MRITKWMIVLRWTQRFAAYYVVPIYVYQLFTKKFLWYTLLFHVIILILHLYWGFFLDLKSFYLRRKLKPGDIIVRKYLRKKNMSWSYEDPYLVMTKGHILSLKHYEFIEEYKKIGGY